MHTFLCAGGSRRVVDRDIAGQLWTQGEIADLDFFTVGIIARELVGETDQATAEVLGFPVVEAGRGQFGSDIRIGITILEGNERPVECDGLLGATDFGRRAGKGDVHLELLGPRLTGRPIGIVVRIDAAADLVGSGGVAFHVQRVDDERLEQAGQFPDCRVIQGGQRILVLLQREVARDDGVAFQRQREAADLRIRRKIAECQRCVHRRVIIDDHETIGGRKRVRVDDAIFQELGRLEELDDQVVAITRLVTQVGEDFLDVGRQVGKAELVVEILAHQPDVLDIEAGSVDQRVRGRITIFIQGLGKAQRQYGVIEGATLDHASIRLNGIGKRQVLAIGGHLEPEGGRRSCAVENGVGVEDDAGRCRVQRDDTCIGRDSRQVDVTVVAVEGRQIQRAVTNHGVGAIPLELLELVCRHAQGDTGWHVDRLDTAEIGTGIDGHYPVAVVVLDLQVGDLDLRTELVRLDGLAAVTGQVQQIGVGAASRSGKVLLARFQQLGGGERQLGAIGEYHGKVAEVGSRVDAGVAGHVGGQRVGSNLAEIEGKIAAVRLEVDNDGGVVGIVEHRQLVRLVLIQHERDLVAVKAEGGRRAVHGAVEGQQVGTGHRIRDMDSHLVAQIAGKGDITVNVDRGGLRRRDDAGEIRPEGVLERGDRDRAIARRVGDGAAVRLGRR